MTSRCSPQARSHTSARLESFIEEPLRERMTAEEMAAVARTSICGC